MLRLATQPQIRQQKDGLEKRQATLQLCFGPSPRMKQPKLCIIFKGTGQRISGADVTPRFHARHTDPHCRRLWSCRLSRIPPLSSGVEKAAWDPRVEVLFQPKAWVDRATAEKWVDVVIKPFIKERESSSGAGEFVMFQDNLDAQVQLPYKQKLKKLRVLTWHGLKDATHLCQVRLLLLISKCASAAQSCADPCLVCLPLLR